MSVSTIRQGQQEKALWTTLWNANGFGENYTRAQDSGDGERSGHSFPLGDYFDCWTCPERLMRHGGPPLPNLYRFPLVVVGARFNHVSLCSGVASPLFKAKTPKQSTPASPDKRGSASRRIAAHFRAIQGACKGNQTPFLLERLLVPMCSCKPLIMWQL